MGFAMTLVYVAFVFLRPQELDPELASYRVMDILAGVAVVATLLSMLTGASRPLLRGPEWRFGVAFILWSALSVALAIRWYGGAFTTLVNLSIPFFTLVLVLMNVTTRRRFAVLVALVWVCALVLLGQAFRAYYSGAEESPFFITTVARGGIDELADSGVPAAEDDPANQSEEDQEPVRYVKRIQALGFLSDPNDFAQFLICLLPLLGLVWRRRRLVRNTALVILPAAGALWGILLTRSRGGLVAAAGLVVAVFVYRLGPRWRRPVGITVLALSVPAFVTLFGYAKADESAASRIEAWSMGLQMLKWYPIWGVGSGLFTDHHERVAHNSYVQCFAETGLVGYFLWLAFIAVGLARVSAVADTSEDVQWQGWARALRLSMIGFLLAALFLSRTTSPMLFFLIALLAALAAMARTGEEVSQMPRHWLPTVLAVELASIVLVWITSRAFY